MDIKIECENGMLSDITIGNYKFEVCEMVKGKNGATDQYLVFGPTPAVGYDIDPEFFELCVENQGIVTWQYGCFDVYETGEVLNQCLDYLKKHELNLNQ